MEAKHGIAEVGIATTGIHHRLAGFEIDARHKHLADTCLTGTGYHLVTVCGKLRTIEVAMGIDEFTI